MKTSYKQQFRNICKSYNFSYIVKPKFHNSLYADLPYLHSWSFLLKYDVQSHKIYMPEFLILSSNNDSIMCHGVKAYEPNKFSQLVYDYRALVQQIKQYKLNLKLNEIQKDFI